MNEDQAKQPASGWTPRGYKEDSRPQRGCWAPGRYMNKCIYCGEGFIGDKRAASCADCAYREAATDGANGETNAEGVCSAPCSCALTWSEEIPKRPGWWWVELYDGKIDIAFVMQRSGEELSCGTFSIPGWTWVSDTFFRRWAGPLVEPLEPSPVESRPNVRVSDCAKEDSANG